MCIRDSGGVGPRCCSPRELLSRSSGRVGQAEVRCVAVALARAGGVAVLGERGATSGRLGVLDAARAVVPARAGTSGSARLLPSRAGGVGQAKVLVVARAVASRKRARRAVASRERAASGRPRCWSLCELLPRVSERHRQVGVLVAAVALLPARGARLPACCTCRSAAFAAMRSATCPLKHMKITPFFFHKVANKPKKAG